MLEIVRSQEEIDRVLDWVREGKEKGSHYAGQSYEMGIEDTIYWLLGDSDDAPDSD